MKYYFKAFGLNIQSEFPFQGIKSPEKGIFDIDVIAGIVPSVLPHCNFKGINYQSNDLQFLLKVPNVADFLIENGNQIIVQPDKQAEFRELELFFLGSAISVLLMQRGIVPFHGSAFEKDNKCIIISGQSGAGKSSLLRYFITEGYRALSDDVCALSIDDNNKVCVFPSYPSSKIWEDIMDKFELQKEDKKQVRPNIRKYKYDLSSNFVEQSLEVDSVYILNSENVKDFRLNEIKGLDKFKHLRKNLYRTKFPEAMGKEKETFIILNHLANQAKIFSLIRSSSIKLLKEFNQFAKQNIIG